MQTIRLGRTNLVVSKNGFGALPIQRVDMDTAKKILRKAYDGGINYFDTARAYTDSEDKMGAALSDVRKEIIISTKTVSTTVEGFWNDLRASLAALKTDYIDIYQFHNPDFCPRPGDGTGLYEAMLEAKAQGLIRFIGITNHRLSIAEEAVVSGLYDTLQFPFSYLSGEKDLALVRLCEEHDVGFICMKALAGGLITNARAAYAYLAQLPVAPIWGIQRERELDDFLVFQNAPAEMDEEITAVLDADRKELQGDFCRGCGYCMPCPAGINIGICSRIGLIMRRAPSEGYYSKFWQDEMEKTKNCLHCGQCTQKCPYGLDAPSLLEKSYLDYQKLLAE
ncbi:MAG: aldo/keto reductase [Ruminococcaceae bacterium]|nr:aldo/keto reductase [Oscillospiraceae bacterium]MBQ4047540.1 aldo/keto reductase [Clostridia bacterium]